MDQLNTAPMITNLRVLRTGKLGLSTVYTLLGFPYDGPTVDNTDLHGTRFTPKTELGWVKGRPLPVYWEHGWRELGRVILGEAHVGEETEKGRLIDIIIDRANAYHDMLEELHESGFLRGSGQAIASMYDVAPDGSILAFHLAEFSLTVEPSNDFAKPVDKQAALIMKKYDIERVPMSTNKKDQKNAKNTTEEVGAVVKEEDVEVATENAEETTTTVDAGVSQEPVGTPDVSERVAQLFKDADKAEEDVRSTDSALKAIRVIGDQMAAVLAEIKGLAQRVESVESATYLVAKRVARETVVDMGSGELDLYRSARNSASADSPKTHEPVAPTIPFDAIGAGNSRGAR